MEKKNCFNITIAGKSYTLCGNESGDYLKSVGSYIESKYNSFAEDLSFRSQPMDMQHVLMQLNIADDYFKCREELYISKRKFEEQAMELEKLKNSLVTMQVKYENLESSTKMIEKKYQQVKDKLYHLERN